MIYDNEISLYRTSMDNCMYCCKHEAIAAAQDDLPEPEETMDLEAVELVNVEARRNRQLAIQDSLQASLHQGTRISSMQQLTCSCTAHLRLVFRLSQACAVSGLFRILLSVPALASNVLLEHM